MSCPSTLKSAGEIFSCDDESIELPTEYYAYTALMIGLVIAIPLLYRQLWVTAWLFFSYYRTPRHLRGGPPGCRPLGKLGHRNLSNEQLNQSPTHDVNGYVNGHSSALASGKVEALFVHPIKSCYPVELESSTITESGLEFDRQFCFASWHEPSSKFSKTEEHAPKKGSSAYWDKTPHWEFLTQRQNPSLTHLKIQIWRPDPDLPGYDEESDMVQSGGCLIVSFPFLPPKSSISNICSIIWAKMRALDLSAVPVWSFQIPLQPTARQIGAKEYDSNGLRIWRDEVAGIDMTSEIPHEVLLNLQAMFLKDVKHRSPSKYARIKSSPPELKLFRVDSRNRRGVYKCAPTESQLGYQANTGFQDSYPIHLQNLASISEYEQHIPHGKAFIPDSRRFRANIYVSGPPPYDEDDWTLVSVGGHELHVSCRTTRCKLPTNNPDTGVLGSDVQPYTYLMKNRAIDEGAPQSGCLGMMLIPTRSTVGQLLKVGDRLCVLKKGRHFFIADAEPEAQRPVL